MLTTCFYSLLYMAPIKADKRDTGKRAHKRPHLQQCDKDIMSRLTLYSLLHRPYHGDDNLILRVTTALSYYNALEASPRTQRCFLNMHKVSVTQTCMHAQSTASMERGMQLCVQTVSLEWPIRKK